MTTSVWDGECGPNRSPLLHLLVAIPSRRIDSLAPIPDSPLTNFYCDSLSSRFVLRHPRGYAVYVPRARSLHSPLPFPLSSATPRRSEPHNPVAAVCDRRKAPSSPLACG